MKRGWHKLLAVTDVYKSSNPYSAPFQMLFKGQTVHVCEFKRDGREERKCRIDSPMRGWLHLAPKNAIIAALMTREFHLDYFSPHMAKLMLNEISDYICDELQWPNGNRVLMTVMSYLIEPEKPDSYGHLVEDEVIEMFNKVEFLQAELSATKGKLNKERQNHAKAVEYGQVLQKQNNLLSLRIKDVMSKGSILDSRIEGLESQMRVTCSEKAMLAVQVEQLKSEKIILQQNATRDMACKGVLQADLALKDAQIEDVKLQIKEIKKQKVQTVRALQEENERLREEIRKLAVEQQENSSPRMTLGGFMSMLSGDKV